MRALDAHQVFRIKAPVSVSSTASRLQSAGEVAHSRLYKGTAPSSRAFEKRDESEWESCLVKFEESYRCSCICYY